MPLLAALAALRAAWEGNIDLPGGRKVPSLTQLQAAATAAEAPAGGADAKPSPKGKSLFRRLLAS